MRVRIPLNRFVIDADKHVYELVRLDTSYHYRRVWGGLAALAKAVLPGDRIKSLGNSQAMVKVGEDRYLVSHACVLACHCPHCGADVGNLCFGKDERSLVIWTHCSRRDLWRSANDGRATRRRRS